MQTSTSALEAIGRHVELARAFSHEVGSPYVISVVAYHFDSLTPETLHCIRETQEASHLLVVYLDRYPAGEASTEERRRFAEEVTGSGHVILEEKVSFGALISRIKPDRLYYSPSTTPSKERRELLEAAGVTEVLVSGRSDSQTVAPISTVTEMLKKLGHDFKNLLGAFQGVFEMARRSTDANESLERYFSIMESALKRSLALATKLYALSSPDSLESGKTDLASCADEVASMLRDASSLPFEVALTVASRPIVHGQSFHITQMLLNLCMNGLEAMEAYEERCLAITVATTMVDQANEYELPPGEYAIIVIVDHGKGISIEDRERLFEPFQSSKRGFVGSGFGLSLVSAREMMERLGGAITIRSEENCGTAVTLVFPLHMATKGDDNYGEET